MLLESCNYFLEMLSLRGKKVQLSKKFLWCSDSNVRREPGASPRYDPSLHIWQVNISTQIWGWGTSATSWCYPRRYWEAHSQQACFSGWHVNRRNSIWKMWTLQSPSKKGHMLLPIHDAYNTESQKSDITQHQQQSSSGLREGSLRTHA